MNFSWCDFFLPINHSALWDSSDYSVNAKIFSGKKIYLSFPILQSVTWQMFSSFNMNWGLL